MSRVAPLVDSRSAADVAAQVRDLLAVYAPGWHAQVVDPLTGEARSVSPLTWSHSTFVATVNSYLLKKKSFQSH